MKDRVIIEKIEDWLRANDPKLNNLCSNVIVTKSPVDITEANPSIFVDLDTPERMSRLTAWESGELLLQVLALEDGRVLLEKYIDIDQDSDLERVLEFFWEYLK